MGTDNTGLTHVTIVRGTTLLNGPVSDKNKKNLHCLVLTKHPKNTHKNNH